jgi:glucosamine 6-phosphate synthetase-like amidotransferase/phosphosugar isomerase protein
MHPVTLHPGETYGRMPASHAMQKTISEQQGAVFNTLKAAIQANIDRLSK